MILTVNGEPRESVVTNLADLWRAETEHLNLDSPKGYAIALNGAKSSAPCREAEMSISDPLSIAGVTLGSRLFLGTAGYPNQRILVDAVAASGSEVVTMSIRRISLDRRASDTVNLLKGLRFLPNTAGCETARDAVLTAELAREALDTNWIKVEVIGDRETLYPDVTELLDATRQLVDAGFVVLPYCTDDPVICQRLADLGAAAVMPMGSLIGSGMGVANPANLELICRRSPVPVIVDAGIGTASDATIAMELGAAGVLLNTAVAKSDDPVTMARSMRHAVEAGRLAYRAGRIPRRGRAEPSSPQLGLVGS
jgi:thiazole synthase